MGKRFTEEQVAKLLGNLESFFDESGDFPKIKDRITALESMGARLAGLDPALIMTNYEALKAQQELLANAIKNSKRGLYVPGIENEKFSIVKALLGARFGFVEMGAEHEGEILKAARDVHERTAANAGTGASGGYFIPDQVIGDVISAIYARSVFFALDGNGETRVSVLDGLIGGNVKIPKVTGGLVAYWVGEEDAITESLMGVADITMNPHLMGILMRITATMQRSAGFGYESLVRRDMISAGAAKLDWTIMFGSGGNHTPRGIVNTNGIQIYRAETGALVTGGHAGIAGSGNWEGGTIDFDGHENMKLALEEVDVVEDGSFATISSPRFFSSLKQLKAQQYSGQVAQMPYIIGPPLSDARLVDAIGAFAKTNQIASNKLPGASVGATTISANLKYTDVLVGNLGQVVVGRWAGIEISSDEGRGTGFASGHVYSKLTVSADVAIRRAQELCLCPDAKVRV